MINDLVGRGSEKASQRGWLVVRTVVDRVEGSMGSPPWESQVGNLGRGAA